MGHKILSEEENCDKWYQEELNKPLEEIREDIFFRADNFAEEEWYDDILLYTRLGVCKPKPEQVETVQKALKILGFPTHVVCRGNKNCLVPGEKQREMQRNCEER